MFFPLCISFMEKSSQNRFKIKKYLEKTKRLINSLKIYVFVSQNLKEKIFKFLKKYFAETFPEPVF